MQIARTSIALFGTIACAVPSTVWAGGQPADIYWADRWNSAHHRFVDGDQDGSYNGPGEVSFVVDPSDPAFFLVEALEVKSEDGQDVAYWVVSAEEWIARGIDLDQDGLIAGAEITVFRDSGALDGASWMRDLAITDDGGVWWVAGGSIANPQNGISRLEDLNGDGDAADAGEQIVMVDGTGTHFVEHDAGSSAITGWAANEIDSAGNGVMAFYDIDEVVYRFEDLNGDGDVLDADESILLLNATGARPDLPMNPDFQDGTLRSMSLRGGGHVWFSRNMASAMEGGERVFYFGTSAREHFDTNINNEAINFLIYRAVDSNGDRDVNDAGEVKLFFDGSSTTGNPNLLTMRGMDVLDDGIVYAVGLAPFPYFAPGPDGNAWIHRFEDLNGDDDAFDPGEQQLELFDLQIAGTSTLFPRPTPYTDLMTDPRGFWVRPRRTETAPADLDGDGQVGFTDLTLLLGSWGTPDADLDGDGTTGFTDLTVLLGAWGP